MVVTRNLQLEATNILSQVCLVVARFLFAVGKNNSGQRSSSWNLPGLRLYSYSLGFVVFLVWFLFFKLRLLVYISN